jgi:hypothetical protein
VASFDLHVLGTPPAFVLSQDQTLHEEKLDRSCSLPNAHVKKHRHPESFTFALNPWQMHRAAEKQCSGREDPLETSSDNLDCQTAIGRAMF